MLYTIEGQIAKNLIEIVKSVVKINSLGANHAKHNNIVIFIGWYSKITIQYWRKIIFYYNLLINIFKVYF